MIDLDQLRTYFFGERTFIINIHIRTISNYTNKQQRPILRFDLFRFASTYIKINFCRNWHSEERAIARVKVRRHSDVTRRYESDRRPGRMNSDRTAEGTFTFCSLPVLLKQFQVYLPAVCPWMDGQYFEINVRSRTYVSRIYLLVERAVYYVWAILNLKSAAAVFLGNYSSRSIFNYATYFALGVVNR